MTLVQIRYWAGAKAAAGVAEESVEADSVAEALRIARERRSDGRFDAILSASSVLRDGRVLSADEQADGLAGSGATGEVTAEAPSVRVEILPPFAGGGA